MAKCANLACRAPTTNRYALTYACSVDCVIAAAKAKAEKRARQGITEARKVAKAARVKHKEDKIRIKPLTALCKEARKLIQKWCRLRDQKWGICISCGVARIDDGSHRYAVGSKYRTARISLNPDQIHGACSACNRFVGGGNVEGYIAGLITRYGPEKLAELAELKRRADHGEDEPLTKPEVIAIKAQYAKMIREFPATNL